MEAHLLVSVLRFLVNICLSSAGDCKESGCFEFIIRAKTYICEACCISNVGGNYLLKNSILMLNGVKPDTIPLQAIVVHAQNARNCL